MSKVKDNRDNSKLYRRYKRGSKLPARLKLYGLFRRHKETGKIQGYCNRALRMTWQSDMVRVTDKQEVLDYIHVMKHDPKPFFKDAVKFRNMIFKEKYADKLQHEYYFVRLTRKDLWDTHGIKVIWDKGFVVKNNVAIKLK